VKAFYASMVQTFDSERTNEVFRPFGCDMAYTQASVNYQIMDALIKTWKRLGFDKTIDIKYSTPSKYVQSIKKVNTEWEKKEDESWPIRKDDTFPYA